MKSNKRVDREGEKFSQKWLDHYTVTTISEKGVMTLKNISGLILDKKYNVANLKHYFQHSSNLWSDAPDEIVKMILLYALQPSRNS